MAGWVEGAMCGMKSRSNTIKMMVRERASQEGTRLNEVTVIKVIQ